jgi:hypothetical protein
LFIIWSAAGDAHEWIFADLAHHFDIVRVAQIHWSPGRVIRNYERFYSDLSVRGVYHRFNKGTGPLTAVVVMDRQPQYEYRQTSRGERRVNTRFLEAKQRYRIKTGGLEVHCGETARENRRDMAMLFGPGVSGHALDKGGAWNGIVETLERDLAGSDRWPSVASLIGVLDEAARYVVLHGERRPVENWRAPSEPLVELLTDDFPALHAILNARPHYLFSPHGGVFRVPVASGELRVGLRSVDDGFIDSRWAASVLDGRYRHPNGYFVPAPRDERYLLLYHLLVHNPSNRDDLERRLFHLANVAAEPNIDTTLRPDDEGETRLESFLSESGYASPKPDDLRITHRPIDAAASNIVGGASVAAGRISAGADYVRGLALVNYWAVRDRILLRATWLRSVKQLLTGRRPGRAKQ